MQWFNDNTHVLDSCLVRVSPIVFGEFEKHLTNLFLIKKPSMKRQTSQQLFKTGFACFSAFTIRKPMSIVLG